MGSFYPRRRIRLMVELDTNMTPSELGGLAEGTAISVMEFGKEHIDMPRYEEVILNVRDAHFSVSACYFSAGA